MSHNIRRHGLKISQTEREIADWLRKYSALYKSAVFVGDGSTIIYMAIHVKRMSKPNFSGGLIAEMKVHCKDGDNWRKLVADSIRKARSAYKL
jgi:hypothetical protein